MIKLIFFAGEAYSKLILAIQENNYYDSDEWRALAFQIKGDFSELGIQICTNFLESDPAIKGNLQRSTYQGNLYQ